MTGMRSSQTRQKIIDLTMRVGELETNAVEMLNLATNYVYFKCKSRAPESTAPVDQ